MPAVSELVASGRTVEEVRELIGADRLIYLDLHGLIRSVRHDNSVIRDFDTSCFSGKYVTGDVSEEYLKNIESLRSDLAKAQRELRFHDRGMDSGTREAESAGECSGAAVGM
jgi:amidophosphoribosyltransferase